MQHRRHKTKLLIPAGAGTNQPADVGDQPGRLGEGRNRIARAAITCASIENINPGTKKRRMRCIVVSRLPAVFQRLMLLEYQIGLDFASGVYSCNINLAGDKATHINKAINFRHKL